MKRLFILLSIFLLCSGFGPETSRDHADNTPVSLKWSNAGHVIDETVDFNDNGATDLSFIQPSADSTTAFQLKDQSGNVDVNYDSTNGRLGIGTDSPSVSFHIKSKSTGDEIMRGEASDGVILFKFREDEEGGAELQMNNTFNVLTNKIDTNGYSYFNGGNVGINDTTPDAKLKVTNDTTNQPSVLIKNPAAHADNSLEIQDSAGTVKTNIDQNGRLNLDVDTQYGNTTGIAFGDTNIYESADDILKIDVGGVEGQRITESGGSIIHKFGNFRHQAHVIGTGDITAELQALVDTYEALYSPVDIHIPEGTFDISTTIDIARPGISIIGAGAGKLHDVATGDASEQITAPTVLRWEGAVGGTMIECAAVANPTPANTQNISHNRFLDFALVGENAAGTQKAGTGIRIKTVMNGQMRVYGKQFTSSVLEMTVIDNADITGGEASDNQGWEIELEFRQLESDDGYGLYLKQNASGNQGNTSFNRFRQIRGQYLDKPGIYDEYGDHNTFQLVHLDRAPGGTAYGVELHGGASNALRSRRELFINLSPGVGGIKIFGTDTYAVASVENRCLYYDKANSAPDPVYETGAEFLWESDSRIIADGTNETTWDNLLDGNFEKTFTATSGNDQNVTSAGTLNQSGAGTGIFNATNFSMTKTDNYDLTGALVALFGGSVVSSGGSGSGAHTVSSISGADFFNTVNNADVTIPTAIAATVRPVDQILGTVTNAFGLNVADSTGTISGSQFGSFYANMTAGVAQNYQIYLSNQTSGFGIYSAGGDSYFAGSIELDGLLDADGGIASNTGTVTVNDHLKLNTTSERIQFAASNTEIYRATNDLTFKDSVAGTVTLSQAENANTTVADLDTTATAGELDDLTDGSTTFTLHDHLSVIQAYDNQSPDPVITPSGTYEYNTIPVDSTVKTSSDYTLSSNVITVNTTGLYKISFYARVYDHTSATTDNYFLFVEEQSLGSGGWSAVQSLSGAFNCLASGWAGTGGSALVEVTATDKFRITIAREDNSAYTINADSTSFLIERLD